MPPVDETAPQENARDLKKWWRDFTKKKKEPAPLVPPPPAPGSIFGIPLSTSIKYANVAISLMQDDGSNYTYGYIPIVVAKCGVFLKDRAIEVEGIFRLAGAARRMNQLQQIFNTPPTYGKSLDWTGYTVHDAANVLRRYLNQLPEPIVPLSLYEKFRTPLRQHQMQAVGNVEAKETDIGDFDYDGTIQTYRSLITQLPPLNRQLLLYVLDMLAIFAAKANVNHMTAANLAVIFQPGMLHHPNHDKLPHEYRLSQDVVIFLIDQQDNFLLGMPGTAADEKTKQEVESGPPTATPGQPSTPTRTLGIGRSVSTNSRSTNNSSRLAGIKRNISVSSRGSRNSQHNAPGTPGTPGTPGVHRSNTVPSRRSPVVSQNRFSKPPESPRASQEQSAANTPQDNHASIETSGVIAAAAAATAAVATTAAATPNQENRTESIAPSISQASAARDQSKERLLGDGAAGTQAGSSRRGLAHLLRPQQSDDGQSRQPNKLRKKRFPSGAQPSGHSSAASLSADPEHAARSPFTSPLQEPITSGDEGPPLRHVSGTSTNGGFTLTETAPTPKTETNPAVDALKGKSVAEVETSKPSSETATLKPRPEALQSDQAESNADVTDTSIGPEPESEKRKEKKRWRFSLSAKRPQDEKNQAFTYGSSSHLPASSEADLSKSGTSITDRSHRRSSAANNEKPVLADLSSNATSARRGSREIVSQEERSPTFDASDRGKGPIGWFKQKLAERKDKDDAKERAKSPPRRDNAGKHPSSTNIDAAANGDNVSRQRSTDISEIIPEAADEDGDRVTTVDRTGPVSATTEAIPAIESTGKESVHQASSIEDYMGDSDREKLATAREVQAILTRQEEEEKATAAAAAGASSAQVEMPQDAADVAVDPAYEKPDMTNHMTNPAEDPTTPKASEQPREQQPKAVLSVTRAAEEGPEALKTESGDKS